MLDDYEEIVRRHSVFVAEVGEIVGVLVLMQTQTGILLDNVAVHPDRQETGLGRRLIALAENEARTRGYAKLDLYTHESMHEDIEIYRALGYTESERKLERGYPRVYLQKVLSR